MRVYLVVDETRFYHPGFVASFLRRTRDGVVGAAVVTRIPAKSNLETYLRANWRKLTFTEMARLAFRKYAMAALEWHGRGRGRDGPFYSVRAVFEAFGVPVLEVQDEINRPGALAVIRGARPDVLVSSQSLIFGPELLSIPAKGCLNRHSALLPRYGGLWPVFQAFRSGENVTGASIHTMEEKLDRGVVLARKPVEIRPGETLSDLYPRCFEASVDVLLEALDKVRCGDLSSCLSSPEEPSYFSFPTDEHWRQFRERGGRFA